MNDARTLYAAWCAVALGTVTAISVASFVVFVFVGGVFGGLNDVGNAVGGALSGALAWLLCPTLGVHSPRLRSLAVMAASLGALLMVVGSVVVVSGAAGWFSASLISTFGGGFTGVWLLTQNHIAKQDRRWPGRLVRLGLICGTVMIIGLLAGFGVATRTDAPQSAPWFVSVASASWIGTYILYPGWSVWLGRYLSRQREPLSTT